MKSQNAQRDGDPSPATGVKNKRPANGSRTVSAQTTRRQEGLGYLVRLAHRGFLRTLAARLAPHNITASQWTTLRALWDEDGYSQVDLAQRINVEKASLTSVLDALERRGLAQRLRSAEDRRVWNVQLTKAGRDLKKDLLPYAAEVNALASSGLSKAEVDEFRRILQKVISNLK